MQRLNWGCGPEQPAGWVNSDRERWSATQDHVGDITDGLPWRDGTFAYTVTVHALQMVPWVQLVPALRELRRVTEPGGVVRILVPDVVEAFRARLVGDGRHFRIADEHESSIDGKFCMYVTQAGSTRSVFTEAWLIELCERAGFPHVLRAHFGEPLLGPVDTASLDSRPEESLIVEARA